MSKPYVPAPSKPEPVPLQAMVSNFNLISLTPEIDITTKQLSLAEVNRPGIHLAGFYDHFDEHRVQILGKAEITYLSTLSESDRDKSVYNLLKYKIPCVVITRDLEAPQHLLSYAKLNNIPIFSTTWVTSEFMAELMRWLKMKLAPRVTLHGVLMDIYGEGVVIMGDSGVGKSETALQLIQRGHRIIADDAVEISRIAHNTLMGTCPSVIQYFTEIRGIGVIDIRRMFGVEAVKPNQVIDMILYLEHYDEHKAYDRMGLENQYIEIMGQNVISHLIPIRPGRNLAVIVEAAAVNNRQKKMGYSAAEELNIKLQQLLDEA